MKQKSKTTIKHKTKTTTTTKKKKNGPRGQPPLSNLPFSGGRTIVGHLPVGAAASPYPPKVHKLDPHRCKEFPYFGDGSRGRHPGRCPKIFLS